MPMTATSCFSTDAPLPYVTPSKIVVDSGAQRSDTTAIRRSSKRVDQ
jgi:hypothetical protein